MLLYQGWRAYFNATSLATSICGSQTVHKPHKLWLHLVGERGYPVSRVVTLTSIRVTGLSRPPQLGQALSELFLLGCLRWTHFSLCEKSQTFLVKNPCIRQFYPFFTVRGHIEERCFVFLQSGCMYTCILLFIYVSLHKRARLKDTLHGLVGLHRGMNF